MWEKALALVERALTDPTGAAFRRLVLGAALGALGWIVGSALHEVRKDLGAALVAAGPWTVIAALIALVILVAVVMSERLIRQAQERHRETSAELDQERRLRADAETKLRTCHRNVMACLRAVRTRDAALSAANLTPCPPLELDDGLSVDLLDTRG